MSGRNSLTTVAASLRILFLVLLVGVASAGEDEVRPPGEDHYERGEDLLGDESPAASEEKLRAALKEFRKAEELARVAGDLAQQERCLKAQNRCLIQLGDFPALLDTLVRLETVLTAMGPDWRLKRLAVLTDVGYLQIVTGDPRGAHETLRQAVAALKDEGPRAQQLLAYARVRLADCCRVLYRLGDALREGQAAVDALRSLDSPEDFVQAVGVLARIHIELMNFDTAEALLEEVSPLIAGEFPELHPEFLPIRAFLEQIKEEYESARSLYTEAALENARLRLPEQAARMVLQVGKVALEEGKPEVAILHCFLAEWMVPEDPFVRITSLHVRARAALARNHLGPAEELIRTFLEDEAAAANPAFLAIMRSELAEVCLRRGRPSGAVPDLRIAIDETARALQGLSSLTGAMLRAEDHDALFDRAVRAAFDQSDPAVTFELLEKSRGAGLLARLGGVQSGSAEDPEAVAELARARKRLAEAGRAVDNARDRKEARVALDELRRVRKHNLALYNRYGHGVLGPATEVLRLREFQESLGDSSRVRKHYLALHDRYGHGVLGPATEVLRLMEFQESLGDSSRVLVHYAFGGDKAYAFVVGENRADVVPLGTADTMQEEIDACLAAIESGADGDLGKALRERLVTPLGLGPEVCQVLVSPDGPVSKVPVSLVFPWEIGVVFVPSATIAGLLNGDSEERGETLLAFGDPAYTVERGAAREAVLRGVAVDRLAASAEEIKSIRLPDEGTRFLGRDACESRFRALVGTRRWRSVHIAAHGYVDQRNPAWSALVLTPEEAEDGLLSVAEITGLKIRADLAVLSACSTGTGRHLEGEGLVALPGAFLQAGTKCVLASLWKVEDGPTREMMEEFYRLWNSGDDLTVADALKGAQEHLKKKHPHPRHWAAWVLWGTPD